MKRIAILATLAAIVTSAVVGSLAGAAAASQTFTAVADSFVSRQGANKTYGSLTYLSVQGGSREQRAYVKVQVSSLDGPVTKATLRVWTLTGSSVGLSVRSVAEDSWSESSLTYRNAPSPSSGVIASSGPFAAHVWIEFNVTALIGEAGTHSFALTSSSGSEMRLASKESGTATAPHLVVESEAASTAPVNQSPPTISGSAQEGQTLTASPGSWSGTPPLAYSYQWRRCDSGGAACVDIVPATAATYTLTSADVGSTIRVTVTASNGAGSASASSAPTAVVQAAASAPSNSSPPTISGSAQEGQTLTASPGSWSGTPPLAYSYQWRRCDASGGSCVDVAGATSPSYAVVAADVGSTLRVTVRASNSEGASSATSAATATVVAGSPVVAAAGDIANSPTSAEGTARLLDAIDPERVLTLGDNAYPDGTLAQFNAYYEPTWGRHKTKTSPSPGNHEYQTPGAQGYFDYFGARAPGLYYSFDLGGWHLISLNSEISMSAGSTQETWLRADLAQHPADCILAYWHRPRWTSGQNHPSDASSAPLWRALYAAGADVVLVGHNHQYERFAPQDPDGRPDPDGIRQFVVGTGGAGLYRFATPIANSEFRDDTHFGVLKLTLHDTRFDWQFLSEAGSTVDAGSDSCEGTTAGDTTPPSAPSNLTASVVNGIRVDLSWTGASDDVGVTAYGVYRDGVLLATTGPATTSYADATVAPATTYAYYVTARDAAGNWSTASNTATVTTPGASTLTFSAEADARVEEAAPGTNYGSSSSLRTDGGSDPDVESFLRFSVTGVTGTVQRAKLRLYATTGTADGPAVYATNNSWLEGGITWSNRSAPTSGAVDDRDSIPGGSWVEYDVSQLVTGLGTYSFLLATGSNDGVDFSSRNASSNRPELVLTVGDSAANGAFSAAAVSLLLDLTANFSSTGEVGGNDGDRSP